MLFEEAVDMGEFRLVSLVCTLGNSKEEFIWLIPAPKLGANVLNADDATVARPTSLGVSYGSTGFHRIGFGMEVDPRRWGGRRERH